MKKGLGRGMESLFPNDDIKEPPSKDVTVIKITSVEPNKKQPRKDFDKEKIQALADSITEHGIIQPIVVTEIKKDRYVIVAGERRWRAAKQAGLKEVPVIIRDYTEQEAAEIALIENLQREDLNPVEEATGYKALMDEFNLTQEEVSEKIGKSRSSIANTIRILSLEQKILDYLKYGEISEGHARALLSIPSGEAREELAGRIITEDLNVRQTEAIVRLMQKKKAAKQQKKKINSQYEIELNSIMEKLSSHFGTKVSHKSLAGKSKIEIEYYSDKDLDRIIRLLGIK